MGAVQGFTVNTYSAIGRGISPAPGKGKAKVYDYQDVHIPVLVASAKARERVFRSITKLEC